MGDSTYVSQYLSGSDPATAPAGGPSPYLPDDYQVQIGELNTLTGHPSHQQRVAAPLYAKPIYTQSDVERLYGKPQQQIMNIQMMLYQMGYLGQNFKHGLMTDTTRQALLSAMGDANKNGYTLDQMWAGLTNNGKSMANGGGGGGGGRSVSAPKTITSSSVVLTGRDSAQALMVQALQNELGREPTSAEVSKFLGVLNGREQSNPTVTTTHISAGGTSQSSVTKQSNVDPSVEATNYGRGLSPAEHSRYAGAQYMGVLDQLLGVH